jgi:hypothetical protein
MSKPWTRFGGVVNGDHKEGREEAWRREAWTQGEERRQAKKRNGTVCGRKI